MLAAGSDEVSTWEVRDEPLLQGYAMSIDPHALYQQMRDQGCFSPADVGRLAQSLWEYYGEELLLFAQIRLRNIEDARELCQDTILSAIESLHQKKGQYSGTVNYRAWLKTIAEHKITDKLRRSGRETLWPSFAGPSHDAEVEPFLDGIKSGDSGPVEELIQQEEIARLRECLKTLRSEWRRALTLYYFKYSTYAQIAKILGTQTDTVGVWLHRAVWQLRECMGSVRISQPRQGT